MDITNNLSDETVLRELGARVVRVRVGRGWTQGQLAEAAGLSKRTVERLERGRSVQLDSLIRVFRALELAQNFNHLIPPPAPSPIAQLKLQGKERRRVRARKAAPRSTAGWVWGDKT